MPQAVWYSFQIFRTFLCYTRFAGKPLHKYSSDRGIHVNLRVSMIYLKNLGLQGNHTTLHIKHHLPMMRSHKVAPEIPMPSKLHSLQGYQEKRRLSTGRGFLTGTRGCKKKVQCYMFGLNLLGELTIRTEAAQEPKCQLVDDKAAAPSARWKQKSKPYPPGSDNGDDPSAVLVDNCDSVESDVPAAKSAASANVHADEDGTDLEPKELDTDAFAISSNAVENGGVDEGHEETRENENEHQGVDLEEGMDQDVDQDVDEEEVDVQDSDNSVAWKHALASHKSKKVPSDGQTGVHDDPQTTLVEGDRVPTDDWHADFEVTVRGHENEEHGGTESQEATMSQHQEAKGFSDDRLTIVLTHIPGHYM
ncbi:hypothetical protein BKA93DRAFT_754639 [Sparassis latifolia]